MSELKATPGPWEVFIDDSGDEWTGWPISISQINDEEKTIVRTGGQWPYEWDAEVSKVEAVSNAHLIAAAPELYEELEKARKIIQHLIDDGYMGYIFQRGDIEAALAKARGES